MEIKRRPTINFFLLLTGYEDIKLLIVFFKVNFIFSLQRFDKFQSAAGVLSTAFSCLHQINYHLVLVRLLQGQGVVRCYYNCQYYVAIIQEAINIDWRHKVLRHVCDSVVYSELCFMLLSRHPLPNYRVIRSGRWVFCKYIYNLPS